MTRSNECDHVCIGLPSGELYDGGTGIHLRQVYDESQFVIVDMHVYDESLLEKWSYGLNHTYPRFCPDFNRAWVTQIVVSNPERLLRRGKRCRDLSPWLT